MISPQTTRARGISVAALTALILFPGCEKPAPSGSREPEKSLATFFKKEVELPIDHTLTDQSGRSLEVTIVGRSETHLFIVRKSDGLESEVAIEGLSEADRSFAAEVPVQAAPAGFMAEAKKPKLSTIDEAYIRAREEAIKKLRDDNELLRREMDASSNEMLVKRRQTEIQQNEKEIARMQADMDRYKIDRDIK